MKGKTGKPTALRGGGLARKGVGMALKGGGMARKGTGSNATPGGKVKKMAMGGMSAMKALPPHLGGSPNPPSDTPIGTNRPVDGVKTPVGSQPIRPTATGGFGGGQTPPKTPGMVRPGFPSRGTPDRGGEGASGGGGRGRNRDMSNRDKRRAFNPQLGGDMPVFNPQLGGDLPVPRVPDGDGLVYKVGMPAPGYSLDGKKNGGKVSKYAKGGAVKMTAGSGSGSGRLEKVAAHKAAKRIPAANLKSGGKVKGK